MLDIDPQIHRVGHGEHGAGDLVEHFHLQHRRAVGQEQEFAAAKVGREDRIEIAEHVEMDFERFAVVHVGLVFAGPAKGFAAFDDVQAGGVDAAGFEQLRVLGGPIFADDADELHGRKIAGRIGKKDGRAAEHVVAARRRGFDAIKATNRRPGGTLTS